MLSDLDHDVLAQLRRRGDRLTKPRDLRLYLYLLEGDSRGAQEVLAAASADAEARGFTVEPALQPGLILTIKTAVDPATLVPVLTWGRELATRHGLEFDGWECRLVRATLAERLLGR